MITIQREGDMLKPTLRCTVCHEALPLASAWLMFPAFTSDQTSAEGKFTHRACADGAGLVNVQSRQYTLWRGVDLFSRLMRST